jgi:hypothetical protein
LKTVALLISALGVLLGGLWLLQGLGLVQMRPILCFADCEPIQGASATWAVIGLLLVVGGLFGILRSRKRGAQQ